MDPTTSAPAERGECFNIAMHVELIRAGWRLYGDVKKDTPFLFIPPELLLMAWIPAVPAATVNDLIRRGVLSGPTVPGKVYLELQDTQ